jgi:quercetin dioxygenase-like cupin family protein
MGDTTIKKIDFGHSPRGKMGHVYLAGGKGGKIVSMRLSREEPGAATPESARDYETVGFVIEGRADRDSEGQHVVLAAGDSWVVPKGAAHRYRIVERFVAVEATSPPAEVHGRDEVPSTIQLAHCVGGETWNGQWR